MRPTNHYKRILRQVLLEATLPACSAAAWSFYVYSQKHTVVDAISAAGIAFFFVLALQGQILRVAKNVRDEDRGDDVIDHLQSVRQGIAELHALGLAQPMTVPAEAAGVPEPPPGYIPSNRMVPLGFTPFLQSAHSTVESGQSYAGVLLAAVGFEFAARRCAEQLGIEAGRRGLAPILRELGRRAENIQVAKTLNTLNGIRNSLVHAENEAPWIRKEEALELIQAFNVGVSYLDGLG